jgi:creatinine amidohydrolase
MAERPDMSLKFHNWWTGPRVMAKAKEIAHNPSHANWFENFPWTRLAGVSLPSGEKPMVDIARLKLSGPAQVRQLLGDGSFGDAYQKSDVDMTALWTIGVDETRGELEREWPSRS